MAAKLRGQRILLIDDVMTSGATLNAAAQVLKQAGAAHVSALVFARTPA
jgi:predicted amidophosphoribosyltransferase